MNTDNLANNNCEACSINSLLASNTEIEQLKPSIPDWNLITIDNIQRLSRVFIFKDYNSATVFTQDIAHCAEQEDHHPAILLEWGKVSVTWWSHKIKGLHKNDFVMAAKTDLLFNY